MSGVQQFRQLEDSGKGYTRPAGVYQKWETGFGDADNQTRF